MTAIGRPRRIDGEKKTYNMVLPVGQLNKLHKLAETSEMSTASLFREILQEGLEIRTGGRRTYEKGVEDACQKVERANRLKTEIAEGVTLGGSIAAKIRKDLHVDTKNGKGA